MRSVHLYPFVPIGRHGGTLRLDAALAGSALLGSAQLYYYDAGSGAWRGPTDRPAATGSGGADPARAARLTPKRRLFPSTLWESGRRPRRDLSHGSGGLGLDGDSVLFLHTTYLAPLAARLAAGCRQVIVDAYDLVWRAHLNDSVAAPVGLGTLRRLYAGSVRPRELRALADASRILVAGHDDYEALRRARFANLDWIPTPTPVDPAAPRQSPDGRLRVGMLGNFAHIATRQTADELLRSALATDPQVTVVLAGLGSDSVSSVEGQIEVIGAVERAEDFYAGIDCVAVPVIGGSGIKCKLAEAVLAGRPVVTTPLGAAGYPPEFQALFTIRDLGDLDADAARQAIADFDPLASRAAFEAVFGGDAVIRRYSEATGASPTTPARRGRPRG